MTYKRRSHRLVLWFLSWCSHLGYTTSSRVIDCPPSNSILQLNNNKNDDTFLLSKTTTSADSWCALWLISDQGHRIPLARSYDGHDWEAYGTIEQQSSRLVVSIDCREDCLLVLPSSKRLKQRYGTFSLILMQLQVTSDNNNNNNNSNNSNNSNNNDDDIRAARFLEQATFGVTRADLWNFNTPIEWLQQQFQLPATSHRAYYRTHWNHRLTHPTRQGIPTHPCQAGTRYRKYAWSDADRQAVLEIQSVGDNQKLIRIQQQKRTLIPNVVNMTVYHPEKGHEPIPDGTYSLCRHIQNGIGSDFQIIFERRCLHVWVNGEARGVPPVHFDAHTPPDLPVLSLDGGVVVEYDNFHFSAHTPQELMLVRNLTCTALPPLAPQPNVVVGMYKGEYYIHDSRFVLLDNTVNNPLEDGGNQIVQMTKNATNPRYRAICATAMPNFLNEAHCRMATTTNECTSERLLGKRIRLDESILDKVYRASGNERLLYVVTGLRLEDSDEGPCTPGAHSRWIQVDSTYCDKDDYKEGSTRALLRQLLQSSTDSHPFLRDISFPVLGFVCDPVNPPQLHIRTHNGKCWENTHRSNYQVYDFSELAELHVRGTAIRQFALDGNFTFPFPASENMSFWYNTIETSVVELGRLKDTVAIHESLDLQDAFADLLGEEDFVGSALICGSPNEVSNDKRGTLFRGAFDAVTHGKRTTSTGDLEQQRTSIWMDIALKSPDQLRQKVAWILSQILVVSPSAISSWFETEIFVNYYDIFVRNAFGNYRDVLKEVAFSPLMAEMLSFHNGHSTAYAWRRHKRVEYANENFAREIMQLFSIGLQQLHSDGSLVLDRSGSPIVTYTNEDVSEMARLWTGLNRQGKRGNIEDNDDKNQIDPMRIKARIKDTFPKMGLNQTYIGDYVPLCADLPEFHFLRKGATYRFLGSLPEPRLLEEPPKWHTDHSIKRLVLSGSSSLLSKLCNSRDGAKCEYRTLVVLDEDLTCVDQECQIELPRIIQVEPGFYYEYTRPACVEQTFYNNGSLMKTKNARYFCGDSRLPIAGTACCNVDNDRADLNFEEFSGEMVSLKTSKNRCATDQLFLCRDPSWTCSGCNQGLDYWTSASCNTMVKFDSNGRVALVHRSEDIEDKLFDSPVREDSKTFFRVEWSGPIEKVLEFYDDWCKNMGCERDSSDNLCLCPVTVMEYRVFTSAPGRDQILDELKIGAFPPDERSGLSKYDLGDGVVMYSKTEKMEESTIFEVVDDNGRRCFRKNIRSEVVVGKEAIIISFRNPPHFMSITYPERRDGMYEMEEGLDHYFYHPNTAPFLAHRFIQRFGFSNPSPRFISVVGTAFRRGIYEATDSSNKKVSFGAGTYGDLTAMIAAILLDRETRSVVLDYDPAHGSILEPFLKFVRVLRSLEFEADLDEPHIRLGVDLQDSIGQQCHKLPSVFSFFLPEHVPSGPVGEASLVCPECLVLTGPKSITLSNGLQSLVKYGFDSAYGGFGLGRSKDESLRQFGDTTLARGKLTYEPSSNVKSDDIVDELILLLTAGRLLEEKRTRLIELYDALLTRNSADSAFINLQQIIVTTPEFHTNAISLNIQSKIPTAKSKKARSEGDYKAVVYLFLDGGFDSYNMLVPHECSGTNRAGIPVHNQYINERGDLALTDEERTLIIDADGQPCNKFALHQELKLLKDLYDDGDLVFFANTGMIENVNMTRMNFQERTTMQLFAHNGMIKETQSMDPKKMIPGTGVLGRLAARLERAGLSSSSISIDESSIAVEPNIGEKPAPAVVSRSGVTIFDRKPAEETFDVKTYAAEFNVISDHYQNSLFGQTWSQQFMKSIEEAEDLKSHLDEAKLGNHWPSFLPDYGLKFSMIAKLLSTYSRRQKQREFFVVTWPGWDHHVDMKRQIQPMFRDLNSGLTWLVKELKHQGIWKDVTIVVSSDFGRTITSNNGKGSDHAWGGHYWMMGGDIRGGQILGHFPNDLTVDSPLNVGRGRLIPTLSWDSVWNGIAEWMGATSNADLDYCLPNRHSASGGGFHSLLKHQDMFKSRPNIRSGFLPEVVDKSSKQGMMQAFEADGVLHLEKDGIYKVNGY